MNIEQSVKAIIVEHLGCDADKVIATARFTDDLGADSLDMADLIMTFEEHYHLAPIDDADSARILTVEDAVKFIANAHKKQVHVESLHDKLAAIEVEKAAFLRSQCAPFGTEACRTLASYDAAIAQMRAAIANTEGAA